MGLVISPKQFYASELLNKQIDSQSIDHEQLQDKAQVEFQLQFDYFSPAQVMQFYRFYTQYSGYIKHELVAQGISQTKLVYVSTADKTMVLNNLQKTCDFLGFDVFIRSNEQTIVMQLLSVDARQVPYQEW